jgi:hypothetical protein
MPYFAAASPLPPFRHSCADIADFHAITMLPFLILRHCRHFHCHFDIIFILMILLPLFTLFRCHYASRRHFHYFARFSFTLSIMPLSLRR